MPHIRFRFLFSTLMLLIPFRSPGAINFRAGNAS